MVEVEIHQILLGIIIMAFGIWWGLTRGQTIGALWFMTGLLWLELGSK